MFSPSQIFHPLTKLPSESIPEQYPFPFNYEPHPLAIRAAEEVMQYIETQNTWKHDFWETDVEDGKVTGKMFGVLVVESADGELGYLAAFSGKLAMQNKWDGFVPPVFDILEKQGFYIEGEKEISAINTEVKTLEANEDYVRLSKELLAAKETSENEIQAKQQQNKDCKEDRDRRRKEGEDETLLGRESSQAHFELKDLKRTWKSKIAQLEEDFNKVDSRIKELKTNRKKMSAALQQRLFDSYTFLNAQGDEKSLWAIFNETPPSGAGECAAPKLLQYAYKNELQPLAFAEFWYGQSPAKEVRKHGHYYPSCKSKCEPILGHMLVGLDVEPDPLLQDSGKGKKIKKLYEDDVILVVNKPEGLLSVPGKITNDSVYSRVEREYPNATGPLTVHRLDKLTSGVMIIAKTMETYVHLQKQFADRVIKKRYVAILDGVLDEDEGEIKLPLRVDLNDRPRQLVCNEHGKDAFTTWKKIEVKEGKTKVYFYPHTGRTHQLRVHAAHHDGLNTPIVGDELYGRVDARLFLHAEEISFVHPVTGKEMNVVAEGEF